MARITSCSASYLTLGAIGLGLAPSAMAQVAVQFERQDYGACLEPQAVALGEFNGLPGLDVVYACRLSNTVRYRPNVGDGSLGTDVELLSLSEPEALVVEDINGDGLDDLCAVSRVQKRVFVLLQTSPGQFTLSSITTFQGPFGSVTLADVDADGRSELLIARGDDPAELLVHPGVGDGTFSAPTSFPLLDRSRQLLPCDLNLDGHLDILSAVSTYVHNGTILLGKSGIDFIEPTFFPGSFGGGPLWLHVDDFNGDGLPDVLASEEDGLEMDLVLWPGEGDGSFGSWAWAAIASNGPDRHVVADFNGDDQPDVLAEAVYNSGNLAPWIGDGLGTLYADGLIPIGSGFSASVSGDVNGDGFDDVVVVTTVNDRLSVLLAQPEPLTAWNSNISGTSGGQHLVAMQLGDEFAGLPYWVLGSASGTNPGLFIDNLPVPLVPDDYTWITLLDPASAFLTGTPGTLGDFGDGFAKFSPSFGQLPPGLAGFVVNHAFAVFDPATSTFVHFSPPLPLSFY